jgi:hypothetical protein
MSEDQILHVLRADIAVFFDLAATLPTDKQEQLKAMVQQLAASQ